MRRKLTKQYILRQISNIDKLELRDILYLERNGYHYNADVYFEWSLKTYYGIKKEETMIEKKINEKKTSKRNTRYK